MARNFNGTSDRIDFTGGINHADNPQTIAAWVNRDTDAASEYIYCSHDSGDTSLSAILWIDTGAADTLRANFWVDGTTNVYAVSPTAAITGHAGTWYHYAVTWDGGTAASGITLYVNGSALGAFSDSGDGVKGSAAGTGSISVGGRIITGDRFFDGSLCEVAHWQRELSASEIATLAAGYSPLHLPASLDFYTPLIREKQELFIGSVGVDANATTVTNHPPIIYRSAQILQFTPKSVVNTTIEVPQGGTLF